MPIPYGFQSINLRDRLAVLRALGKPLLTTGPLVDQFESRISALTGSVSGAVAVTSGTAALHASYAALSLKPGDEVITSPLSFVATAATATQMGATVLFADVQQDTGNLNPQAVEPLVSDKTKVITAVDFAGHPAELDELGAIAKAHGAFFFEDAAHSIGSTYKGRQVGADADLVSFSFFPTKNMTTGEGGAVTGSNKALLEAVRKFRAHGLVRESENFQLSDQGSWHQEVQSFGLNYRLPDILCALGLSQISRIYTLKAKRKKIFDRYVAGLSKVEGISIPAVRSYVEPMWHLFPIRVDPARRQSTFDYLRANGVLVQVNYMPIYWHPVYRELGYKRGMCPEAERYYLSEISLPMYPDLTRQDQDRVIDLIRKAFL